MLSTLPIQTSSAHATFVESGWVAHDFRAWLKAESDDEIVSSDLLIEATFEYDAERDIHSSSRGSTLPPLDLQLDFNQSHITPIRLNLGAKWVDEDDLFPFRFELPLYDIDVELDADKMKLSILSLSYSSGTYFERNLASDTFDDRRNLPMELVDRTGVGSELEVETRVECFWKPHKYEDDVVSVLATVQGVVKFGSRSTVKSGEAGKVVQLERTARVVLDLRGPDGVPFGHEVFKMFPWAVLDNTGRAQGEPFQFQLQHGFYIPIGMVKDASLVASIYVK